jgi:hypothetical protein
MGKRWWIAGLVGATVVAMCLGGVVRHLTSAGYISKQLTAAIDSAHGVNRVAIGSSNFNLLNGSYACTNLEYVPDTLLIAERKEAGTPKRTRTSVTVSSLRVHGIHRWSLLRGRIDADSVTIDGARVAVYLDRTAGPPPTVQPATLPHTSFRAIDRRVRIDVIRVTNSEIGYSEKAKDGGRPGTIRFTDLWATVYNVTNDSTRMTPASPCTIDLRTRIAGAGRLNATFDYDLLSPALSMKYRGAVARMSADPLNELLVDLEGIRITSGVVDSTWFDFKVSNDVASGTMQVLYQDVDIEILDKVSLDRGVLARFQTFVADKTKLNHSNPPDDRTPAKVVTIVRERTTETSLLKFLWESLREGILATLGV